ncbi:MAG: type I asparaginase [Oscillospiraceae bacterium]|nr:type I asparaginase [Oscillospiraceae bacterium]
MDKVLILNTGGTIGMALTANGYTPIKGYFRTELERIEELEHENMPKWDMIEMDPILDSSNITVNDWNKIGEVIRDNYDDYCGFVIVHGTDTMAYTASALSFMLRNLDKPVVLTGSQIPLCELRSDGRDNLITSLVIAKDAVVKEVCLYFGGKLMRGNRATKFSADKLIAFKSCNYPYLADAGITIKYNPNLLRQPTGGKFELQKLDDVPIGVLKIFPGIQFGLFESMITENLKGIVFETFGSGNVPGNGGELIPIIKSSFDHGAVIVVCSQCPQGTVSLGTYETSSGLKKAGAVAGHDLTTEAAVAKLYYLFSCGYSAEEVKKYMEIDLVGELTE